MSKKRETRTAREYAKIYGPAVLITIVGFVVAYQFVDPAPPQRISIATGSPQGAYFAYGKTYSEILERNGVQLEVRATAGSVENIQLLQAESQPVDVAFMQGGIG